MNKRFRIAFSFAGKKREFVAQVAHFLAERFGEDKILYDHFHKAEFARPRLAYHLPKLYFHQSDLIVAVLCRSYQSREWCGLEWDAIFRAHKKGRDAGIMLTRFDRARGRGLQDLDGYLELDEQEPRSVANLILERLAVNERRPKNFYTRPRPAGPDWPAIAPPFAWSIADHTAARDAFGRLIVRDAGLRLLPIHGASETGKSQLTRMFHTHTRDILALRCGRFDFKGSSDIRQEMRAFANDLQVSEPAGGTVATQLAEVFGQVHNTPRPTLLIFDTFEQAGEAGTWMKSSLLVALAKYPWLRVIVAGKRVCKTADESWKDLSFPPLKLRPPSPDDWFAYGRLHKPGITLQFVREAHLLSGGKVSLLAQLLGPA